MNEKDLPKAFEDLIAKGLIIKDRERYKITPEGEEALEHFKEHDPELYEKISKLVDVTIDDFKKGNIELQAKTKSGGLQDSNPANFLEFSKNILFLMNVPDKDGYRDSRFKTNSEDEIDSDYKANWHFLQEARIFEINKNLIPLFEHTTARKFKTIKLPFPIIFVDMKFKVSDGTTYCGLLMYENDKIYRDENEIVHIKSMNLEDWRKRITVIATGSKPSEKGNLISDFKFYLGEHKGDPNAPKDFNVIKNEIENYIFNFLDFLFDPDVEIIEVTRTEEQIRKRVDEGKLPTPRISNVVRVTGVLKKYVENMEKYLENAEKRHFSHRFWVRGFWRHLRSAYWKHKQGMTIWIPPHIRGQGLLIVKRYQVKQLPKKEGDVKNANATAN